MMSKKSTDLTNSTMVGLNQGSPVQADNNSVISKESPASAFQNKFADGGGDCDNISWLNESKQVDQNASDDEHQMCNLMKSPVFKTPSVSDLRRRSRTSGSRKYLELEDLSLSPSILGCIPKISPILKPESSDISIDLPSPVISGFVSDRIPESLQPHVEVPDVSWTSSFATPRASKATPCANLNTDERKVLLPSENAFKPKQPRMLFTPDGKSDCSDILEIEESFMHAKAARSSNISEILCVVDAESDSEISSSPELKRKYASNIHTQDTCVIVGGKANKNLPIISSSLKRRRVTSESVEECTVLSSPSTNIQAVTPLTEPCNQESHENGKNFTESLHHIERLQSEGIGASDTETNGADSLLLTEALDSNLMKDNTQDFAHDISMTTLEEICQTSELMHERFESPGGSFLDESFGDKNHMCETSTPISHDFKTALPKQNNLYKRKKRLIFKIHNSSGNSDLPNKKNVQSKATFESNCMLSEGNIAGPSTRKIKLSSENEASLRTRIQTIKARCPKRNFSYFVNKPSSVETNQHFEDYQLAIEDLLNSALYLEKNSWKPNTPKLSTSSCQQSEVAKKMENLEGFIPFSNLAGGRAETKNVKYTCLEANACSDSNVDLISLHQSNHIGKNQCKGVSFRYEVTHIANVTECVNGSCKDACTSDSSLVNVNRQGFKKCEADNSVLRSDVECTGSGSKSGQSEQFVDGITVNNVQSVGSVGMKPVLDMVEPNDLILPGSPVLKSKGKSKKVRTNISQSTAKQEECKSVRSKDVNDNNVAKETQHVDESSPSILSGFCIDSQFPVLGEDTQAMLETVGSTTFSQWNPVIEEKHSLNEESPEKQIVKANGKSEHGNDILNQSPPLKRKSFYKRKTHSSNNICFELPQKAENLHLDLAMENYFDKEILTDESGKAELNKLTATCSVSNYKSPTKCKENHVLNQEYETEVSRKTVQRIKNCSTIKESIKSLPVVADSTKSERALQNAESLFDENTTAMGFQTAAGRAVKVPVQALKNAIKLFSDCNEISEDPNVQSISQEIFKKPRDVFVGHQKALATNQKFSPSKGSVTTIENSLHVKCNVLANTYRTSARVSEEPLRKSVHKFSEKNRPVCNEFQVFVTENTKPVSVSKESLSKAKQMVSEQQPHDNGTQGFSTINGNTVIKCGESLKVKHLLSQEDLLLDKKFQGFATASGKSVTVSEESLKQANQLFSEQPLLDNEFQGFSTANGNLVKVNEESLTKAKRLLSEDLLLDNKFQEFSTASGKSFSVSEDSLKKAMNLFSEDILVNKVEEHERNNRKSVAVSDCSPRKSKQIFSGTDIQHGNKFVGFSTASGKAVTVSEQSLKQAKQLFSEEQQSVDNFEGVAAANGKSVKLFEESYKKANNLFSEDVLDNNFREYATANRKSVSQSDYSSKQIFPCADMQHDNTFQGFATASGKSITVSEDSLKKVKQLFSEDQLSVDKKYQGFSAANGKSISVSEDSLKKANNLFSEDILANNFEECARANRKLVNASDYSSKQIFSDSDLQVVKNFEGFASVSGKAVAVSEESLEKARQLFSEEQQCLDRNFQGFATANGKSVAVSEESLEQARQLFSEEQPCDKKFQGFATATGKSVAVSEESLKQARQLFSEEGQPCEKKFEGFATAGGKSVAVSEESLMQARQLFSEEGQPCDKKFERFATAGGKSVAVSEESLKQATQLFSEEGQPCDKKFEGFATAGGKSVAVSEESLKQATQLFSEEGQPCDKKFEGFATAGGKSVAVSEESLKQARQLFSEEGQPCDKKFEGFATAGGKSVAVSEESLKQARQLFSEERQPCDKKFEGFATAGGKSVAVSEESLKQARQLFSEEGQPCDKKFEGFATAGGKSVAVSEESLKQARQLFSEEGQPCDKKFEGFATAGGKSVAVSEESLKQARQLFSEEGQPCDKKFEGFATAGGKSVAVSEESLKQARQLFSEEGQPCDKKFEGFATANGKSVAVSEESLKQARQLFSEEGQPCDKKFEGFATAGGNSVAVSEESLKQARQLFSEEGQPCDKKFEGFATANGKSVTVSEESLKKGKKLFSEIDAQPVDDLSHVIRESCSKAAEVAEESMKNARDLPSGNNENDMVAPPHSAEVVCDYKGQQHKSFCEGEKAILEDKSTSEKGHCSTKVSSSYLCPTESVTTPKKKNKYRKNIHNIISYRNCSVLSLSEITESATALLADEDMSKEVIPNWVNTYITCPSVMDDRNLQDRFQAFICSDEGLGEKIPSCEIQTSPVLGSHDRFRRRSCPERKVPVIRTEDNLRISPQLQSSFRIPYKEKLLFETPTCSESKSCPKKRSARNLLFSAPLSKKQRLESNKKPDSSTSSVEIKSDSFNSRQVSQLVLDGRKQAREDQKRAITVKNSIRPCKGSHLSVKIARRAEQMPLRKALGDCIPSEIETYELFKHGILKAVLETTSENSKEFRFSAWDFYSFSVCVENTCGIPAGDGAMVILSDKSEAGVTEISDAFLASPGVDPQLVPEGWITNHYRWIVWKFASIERRFPAVFGGRCLTMDNVLLHLKYRYDREIDRSERSALRKILERDDTSVKTMVLCVASIIKEQSICAKDANDCHNKTTSGAEDKANCINNKPCGEKISLELTDGWYSIKTAIDQEMLGFVNRGIVKVGTKLITHGAELVGCESGCSPLEVPQSVFLKIYTNSTRRARWDTKLGFYYHSSFLPISLSSMLPHGGLASCIDVLIFRVYPLLYVEKTKDNKNVIRNGRSEAKQVMEFESTWQKWVEQVCSQVSAEFQKRQGRSSTKHKSVLSNVTADKHIKSITSGEELCELLENASDPARIHSVLSGTQQDIVDEYKRNFQEKLNQEAEAEIKKRLNSESAPVQRHVTSLLKIRLMDVKNPEAKRAAILSIWHPSEEIVTFFKEGKAVRIFNVAASGVRGSDLQLTATRQTQYKELNREIKSNFCSRVYTSLEEACSQNFHPVCGEFDTIGVVAHIGAGPHGTSNFQTVYLAGSDFSVMGIAFWGGVKEFGAENILTPRSIVSVSNLQWRQSASWKFPCAYASEFTIFSRNPREKHLQAAMEAFQQEIGKELEEFVTTCQEKISLVLSGKPNPENAGRSFRNSVSPFLARAHLPPVQTPGQGLRVPNRTLGSLSAPTLGRKISHRTMCDTSKWNSPVSTIQSASKNNAGLVRSDIMPDSPAERVSEDVKKRIKQLESYGMPSPVVPVLGKVTRSVRKKFKLPVKDNEETKKQDVVNTRATANKTSVQEDSPPLDLEFEPG